ncbi:uncharacterized protein LOC133905770 [Phragmites australis]|uniref:uncharacterized protein LOC133905770 n=1 Tax=Phragmites australis TaxID=29695 RepID=UPI002D77004A|nr:uncharacterized protein LOC133905770 [Phragmites australis]
MYPIAWVTVENETYDSWYWFVSLLQKNLNISAGGEGWVLIFDQQKGLLKVVAKLIPNAEHGMCARHIYENWRKKYTDHKLAQDTPQGANGMMNTAVEHWCRAHFKLGSYSDSIDNNICESFNNSIMDSRFLPVISMHESIRCKVMVRIQENRSKAHKWLGTICPNMFKKLKLNIERSAKCSVLWNGQDGFEVKEKEMRRYTVNLV